MLLFSLHACLMVVNFSDGERDPLEEPTHEEDPEPPEGPPMVVGDAAGDAIGSHGVWLVADNQDEGPGALVVASALGLARFTDAITAPVWWSSASLLVEGETHSFVNLGDRIAVGQPTARAVWLLPDETEGRVDPASAATGTITSHEEESALGAALAAGDYDGDGALDLALGDPTAHGGDGDAYLGLNVADAVAWDAAEREVAVRGEGGLGVAIAVGAIGGAGTDDLLACDAADRCFWVTGPQDDDVVEAATGVFTGGADPRLLDIDGDDADDLLLRSSTAATVWYGPLPPGAYDASTAGWRVVGSAMGACTGAEGALVCGVDDALVEVPSPVASIDLGTVFATGADGDLLGVMLSDRVPFGDTADLAAAAPGSDFTGEDAGAVWLEAWP